MGNFVLGWNNTYTINNSNNHSSFSRDKQKIITYAKDKVFSQSSSTAFVVD